MLERADASRGRFRTFLLTALKNFAANEHERSVALKRGGGAAVLSLDFGSAEDRYLLEPVDGDTPERSFDRRWAVAVLDRVLVRLKERTAARGRGEHFDTLRAYLTGEESEKSYAEAAAHLGVSPGAVKVAVHRLRRQFRQLLREEIMQTVSSPEAVDVEMRHLWSAVARPGP